FWINFAYCFCIKYFIIWQAPNNKFCSNNKPKIMFTHGKPDLPQDLDPKKKGTLKNTDASESSSEQLWKAFKGGDEAAFIQIYHLYANVLFNYGCQFTSDSEMVK